MMNDKQRTRLVELLKNAPRNTRAFYDQYADYLLANGAIVPPCKVGDTIYKPIVTDDTNEPAIWEIIITMMDIDIGKDGVSPDSFVVGLLRNTQCGESANFSDFGKTVFLTKEEAEEALKGGVLG